MTNDESTNTSGTSEADNSSDPINIDEASQPAWQAYNDMFETKRRHYEFLEVLENKKKKFNISPSENDKQKLASYLSQHDEQVKNFTRLSIELKSTAPESHIKLFSFIAQLGDGEPNKKTQH